MPDLIMRSRRFVTTFMETKLFAQILAATVLTMVMVSVLVIPLQALAPLRTAIVWTVTHDYDFSGQGQRLQAWASKQGGWSAAARGTWSSLVALIGPWFELETERRAVGPSVPVVRVQKDPIMPVEGAVLLGFGWTPPGGAEAFHEGLDLAVPVGTPVVAVTDGIVMEIRIDQSLGRLVEINHGQVIGIYAQLGAIRVVAGQQVVQGERIGLVAEPTGSESMLPAHLHFEVRTMNGRVPVDPAAYLGLGGRKL